MHEITLFEAMYSARSIRKLGVDPVSEEPLPADLAALLRQLDRIPPIGRQ